MQCYHCGREVFGTLHTQRTFKVDFYLLHTGQTELEFFFNPKQDAPPLKYRRLIHPIDVFTCVQCYARPEIRRLLEDDFTGRRELVEVSKPGHEQHITHGQ
jgi:hypothetical protein